MVNSDKFSERLQKILEHYDLSAAAFADAIDVGRSSISHILSGRNKPSLDFVLKIVQAFPEVELYWLLNGKGKFPVSKEKSSHNHKNFGADLFSEKEKEEAAMEPSSSTSVKPLAGSYSSLSTTGGKKIKKIVLFYEDGTFEAFEN